MFIRLTQVIIIFRKLQLLVIPRRDVSSRIPVFKSRLLPLLILVLDKL